MSDFGEPWTTMDRDVFDRDKVCVSHGWHSEIAKHIAACVNHMAGRDPAKLAALLEAVRDVIAGQDLSLRLPGRIDDLAAALAAFEKGAENEQ